MAPGRPSGDRQRGRAMVMALFFVSGASGLVYEVVWLRMFAAVFGVTLYATSVVVACFMGGMAAGSFVVGRMVERRGRGLEMYARLEILLGLYALGLPAGIAGSRRLYAAVYDAVADNFTGLTVIRGVTSAALIFLPAALMGGTLPALSQRLASKEHPVGAIAGRLYSINTFGAVVGIFAAVVLLIPRYGTRGANTLCGIANLTVGVAAWVMALWSRAPPSPAVAVPPPAVGRETSRARRPTLIVAALSGFAALGYQLIWIRGITLNVPDTIFSFGATLAAFLAGVALGSRLLSARRFASRGWSFLGLCQTAIAGFAIASPWLLRWSFAPSAGASESTAELSQLLARHWALVLLALAPPTVLMGATVAVAFRLHEQATGARALGIGRVYAANTVGAIGGSLLTGVLLVPHLGMVRALVPLAVVNLVGAAVAYRQVPTAKSALRWVPSVVVATAALALVFATRVRFYELPPGRIALSQEDATGVVDVVEQDGVRTLFANRVHSWGSDAPDMIASMNRQGLLPLLLHPAPRRVIEIGLATGVASAPFLHDPRVEKLIVVEISPAIASACRLYDQHNGRLLEHPKAQVVVDDGRSYLMLSRESFDVVILGLFTPYSPWASLLFSRELYQVTLERLARGGLVVQWLPLQQLTPEALRSVVATFQSVFPDAHAWEKAQYLALVGGKDLPALNVRRLQEVWATPGIGALSARFGFGDAASVLSTYFMGPAELRAFARGGEPNTEDRPRVEWSPIQSRPDRVGVLVENLERLLAFRARPMLPADLPDDQRPPVERAFEARGLALRGAMLEIRRDFRGAFEHFRRAVALNPNEEIAAPQLRKYQRVFESMRRAGAMPPPGH